MFKRGDRNDQAIMEQLLWERRGEISMDRICYPKSIEKMVMRIVDSYKKKRKG